MNAGVIASRSGGSGIVVETTGFPAGRCVCVWGGPTGMFLTFTRRNRQCVHVCVAVPGSTFGVGENNPQRALP